MLRELAVQNLALIEDVRVELPQGFCAWTGETGAGKTLLLTALSLLLGERGSADLIRADADELRITGRFEVLASGARDAVERLLGGPLEEGELIITRRHNRAGRSFAYVNEQPVAVATLRQLGELLVDIHGQRESHSLLRPAYQLQMLDAFGGLESLREEYAVRAEAVRELRRHRTQLLDQRQQRQRELSLLRFEREELDKADLRPGELAELASEREKLAHAQALQAFAVAGSDALYDAEGSVFEQLGKLAREAEKWGAVDPQLADIARRLEALSSESQDVADTLRDLAQTWQADPQRLEEAEERLQLLRRLEAKYAKTVEELIAYRGQLDRQEAGLQKQEDDLAGIEEDLGAAFDELKRAGIELSRQRHKIAKKLAAEVQRQLTDLGMRDAQFAMELAPVSLGDEPLTGEVPSAGLEQAEMVLAANRGEPTRPLRKVASGGELSRTMLALKTVLAAQDQLGTLVFDEIDANVGGRLGDVLGEKLAALGKTHQVICVTHLPQVASYARHQWTIRKSRRGKRTTTTIHLLAEEDRVDELASMLRGDSRGETTRQEALAMLAAARQRWSPDGRRHSAS
jgi:DNA repair protein RecN (Recombination protein N)